jgi:hypothetical protein
METADFVHLQQTRATVHRGCMSFLRLLRHAHTHEPAAVSDLERALLAHYTKLAELDAQIANTSMPLP